MPGFSWAAAGDVGLGLAQGISSWYAAGAAADVASANRDLAKAQADSANTIRKAQNEQRASGLSLAATMRSLGYKAALTNAGNAVNGADELIARTGEAWTRGNFEQGIRGAEQLGSLTARAAAAGVGGASVNAVSYSVRLQQGRLTERMHERQDEQSYELVKQRSGIMGATTSRLDISPLSPNFDYSQNFSPASTPVQGGGASGLIASLAEGLLRKKDSLQVALDSIPQQKPYTPFEANWPTDLTLN